MRDIESFFLSLFLGIAFICLFHIALNVEDINKKTNDCTCTQCIEEVNN